MNKSHYALRLGYALRLSHGAEIFPGKPCHPRSPLGCGIEAREGTDSASGGRDAGTSARDSPPRATASGFVIGSLPSSFSARRCCGCGLRVKVSYTLSESGSGFARARHGMRSRKRTRRRASGRDESIAASSDGKRRWCHARRRSSGVRRSSRSRSRRRCRRSGQARLSRKAAHERSSVELLGCRRHCWKKRPRCTSRHRKLRLVTSSASLACETEAGVCCGTRRRSGS